MLESSGNAVPEDDAPFDPELEDDLGAELEFRGDQLEQSLQEARAEADHHRDTAQRVQAEFENYRKRIQRDQADAVKRAGERIIAEMLPVIDNLERAIEHAAAQDTPADTLSGVEMVLSQMIDLLAKEGVGAIDPLGGEFNALEHQAVGQKEDPEVPEGTVVEVFQKGYAMHGRIIRSAMVVVSTGGPTPEGG